MCSVKSNIPFETEAQFQRAIVELARLAGWAIFHVSDSRKPGPNGTLVGDRMTKGFPDLVLAGHGRILFRELKRESGRLSKEQVEWLDVLSSNGADAKVWRPSDWDEIESVLVGAS